MPVFLFFCDLYVKHGGRNFIKDRQSRDFVAEMGSNPIEPFLLLRKGKTERAFSAHILCVIFLYAQNYI